MVMINDHDVDPQCLETFPLWLRTLGEDATGLAELIANSALSDAARRTLVGGLNYLFKSLDLIPDGIDDIGYLDDAFVLRVVCALTAKDNPGETDPEKLKLFRQLANDVQLIEQFLGRDYLRLQTYARGLHKGTARGRSVEDIVSNPDVLTEFVSELQSFAQGYTAPSFSHEQKNLIKLRAFFDAKLPR